MVDIDEALDPTTVAGGIEVHPEYAPGDTGGRRAVVRLWGEIDHSLRPDASEAMMALLGHDGAEVELLQLLKCGSRQLLGRHDGLRDFGGVVLFCGERRVGFVAHFSVAPLSEKNL